MTKISDFVTKWGSYWPSMSSTICECASFQAVCRGRHVHPLLPTVSFRSCNHFDLSSWRGMMPTARKARRRPRSQTVPTCRSAHASSIQQTTMLNVSIPHNFESDCNRIISSQTSFSRSRHGLSEATSLWTRIVAFGYSNLCEDTIPLARFQYSLLYHSSGAVASTHGVGRQAYHVIARAGEWKVHNVQTWSFVCLWCMACVVLLYRFGVLSLRVRVLYFVVGRASPGTNTPREQVGILW